jgi:hypothetical protein
MLYLFHLSSYQVLTNQNMLEYESFIIIHTDTWVVKFSTLIKHPILINISVFSDSLLSDVNAYITL